MSRLGGDGLSQPISGPIVGVPFAYTPAIVWAGNTIGSIVCQCVRLGAGAILIAGSFAETAGTALVTLLIPLPTGITCVTQGTCPVGEVGQVTSGTPTSRLIATNGATSISSAVAMSGVVTSFMFYAVVPTLG